MGNTWTITVWKKSDFNGEYGNEIFWQGESMLSAFINFFSARSTGSGCISLQYRGFKR